MSRQLEPRSPAALLHSPAAAPRCRSAPSKRLLLHEAAEEAPAAAKCARLAVDYSSAAPQDCLSAPGSPCAPAPSAPGGQGSPSSAQGPSLVAGYLLLPLLDREHVSRALDINTGRELRCKVSGRVARRDLGAAPAFGAWDCGRGVDPTRGGEGGQKARRFFFVLNGIFGASAKAAVMNRLEYPAFQGQPDRMFCTTKGRSDLQKSAAFL